MRQTTISGRDETRYPIAEALWIVAGIILLLVFGDGLTLLVLALGIVTVATAWWIHRRVDHRVGSKGHAMMMILPFILAAAAALVAVLTLVAPAQAATIDSRFDICAALQNSTSLATVETSLEARGSSASNAGALTGITIRQQCPDQAAGVMAQIS
jgi:predicted PurR-regulated permease PerM